jgi:hypothetical protein
MKKLILLLFVINIYAQSPKQVLYSFYDWKYPKIKVESNKISIVIDDPADKSVIDNQVSAYLTKGLNFRNLEIVTPEKSDYSLFIQPINTQLSTTVEKSSFITETSYVGKIVFTSKLNFTIKRKNEVVYSKDFNYFEVVSDVSAYNNYSIKTPEIASQLIQQKLQNESGTILSKCQDIYQSNVIYGFFKEIKQTIDFERIEENLPLYKFKDSPEFEEINKSVDDLSVLKNLEDNIDNDLKTKKLIAEKIQFWENEVLKYDYSNKKTRKIYWALMANISTGYYALGDNTKAIEFKDKALFADYNKSYTYLAEMPLQKIKDQGLVFDKNGKPFVAFESNNFSKKQNFDAVYFANSKGKMILNSDISEEDLAIKKDRVQVVYQVLACSKFYDFLANVITDFNEKEEDKSLFFKNTDGYFLKLTERYNNLSKELLVANLKNFNMDEKNVILKASNTIHDLTDILYERLNQSIIESKHSEIEKVVSDMNKAFLKLDDLLLNYGGNSNKADLQTLANMVFAGQNKTLLELPYLGLLADELTTEVHSEYTEQPKIYQSLFKQYKKTLNTFFASDILKNLHEKEKIKFDNIMYSFYVPLSRAKIENINTEFKNKYNSESILRLLMLYAK